MGAQSGWAMVPAVSHDETFEVSAGPTEFAINGIEIPGASCRIVGNSPALRRTLSMVRMVAPTEATVLITGETGTGKESIAEAIHKFSGRSNRPFVKLNCAAVPAGLLESELFGHERGAFTGADARRAGRFESAGGGTILLDEIGELPLELQPKLLRVLQEREFERVGGTESVRINVRVVAATNRDLKLAVEDGAFRLDLFYRLNVFPIQVPALRERENDIPLLLQYFVSRYSSQMGKSIRSISAKTLELFQAYSWPGNIRELQNIVERSVILTSGSVLAVNESWFAKVLSQSDSRSLSQPVEDKRSEERKLIEAALAESRGRIGGPSGAAAKLQIPRTTLASRIKTLRIEKGQFRFNRPGS
jgi:formate hydrogenlyase transcriptional activator